MSRESNKRERKPYRALLIASISLVLVGLLFYIISLFLMLELVTLRFLLPGFFALLIAMIAATSWIAIEIGRARLRKGKSFWIPYFCIVGPVVLYFIVNSLMGGW